MEDRRYDREVGGEHLTVLTSPSVLKTSFRWRALAAGIRTVILSAENDKDLDDLPEVIRNEMEFHLVSNMDEVIKVALEGVPPAVAAIVPEIVPAEGGTIAH